MIELLLVAVLVGIVLYLVLTDDTPAEPMTEEDWRAW